MVFGMEAKKTAQRQNMKQGRRVYWFITRADVSNTRFYMCFYRCWLDVQRGGLQSINTFDIRLMTKHMHEMRA